MVHLWVVSEQRHIGVIDIGSNSMRLVVYDDLSRAPFPRFNEKSITALAAGIDADGRFTDEACAGALRAMERFASIAEAMRVERIDVIATEAMRRAANGPDLIASIRELTGLTPQVLSGDDEARLAALGVVAGAHEPRGLVGDLGGGSLEVAEVAVDRVGERLASMPLGALPVTALMAESFGDAKRHVDATLADQLPPLMTDPTLYAVGGGWRAIARVHIATNDWPIRTVHGYVLPAADARAFAKSIARMSTDEIAELPDVPSRRIDTLAASALVMERLIKVLKPEQVVFSATGLREGWLYDQLSPDEQRLDPLVEGAQAIGLPIARVPAFSAALDRWTEQLFPGETPADRRLRLAACALTDLCWRDHPKLRASDAFRRVLEMPFVGISHPERAFLGVVLLARYGGKIDDEVTAVTDRLMSDHEVRRAEILGRVLLLAHRVSASVPRILDQVRIRIDADSVRLEIDAATVAPDSDAVQSRLRQLAKVVGVDNTEIVDA